MTDRTRPTGHLTILGGGPAGLTAGYYAEKRHLPFTLYEARSGVGGNSVTFNRGDFLFDSGAHLLLARDTEVMNEISELLGGDLTEISLPIQTYYDGKMLDFPFSPLNLLRNMGLHVFARASAEIIKQKLTGGRLNGSFETLAIRLYGRTIAERLLLNYSEKLWGMPCSQLSPKIAGELLRGLDVSSLFTEAVRGRAAKIRRLSGPMYYPKKGFGLIVDRLSEFCGQSRIRTNSQVTTVWHDHRRIKAIEVNGEERTTTDKVLSTLPLNILIQRMRPKPPAEILGLADGLCFRSLALVTLFLRRDSVTECASVHFPDGHFKVSRIHEPKNRSKYMAPSDRTSLVCEIPCQKGDGIWNLEDYALTQMVVSGLVKMGWIRDEEVSDGTVKRLNYAYPVLDIDYERRVRRIFAYLDRFDNLKVVGRNAVFEYLSFHHIMRMSKAAIETCQNS